MREGSSTQKRRAAQSCEVDAANGLTIESQLHSGKRDVELKSETVAHEEIADYQQSVEEDGSQLSNANQIQIKEELEQLKRQFEALQAEKDNL